MKPDKLIRTITTITLNPAIDQTITIDNFSAGSVNRVQEIRNDPGGKGVNVASALADYGLQTAATGFLGKDNPALFERLFADKKIQDRFVRLDGYTRTGIKIVDRTRQETTDINYPGLMPSETDVQALFTLLGKMVSPDNWFVIAGSIPSNTSADIYNKLICALKNKGGHVALDASGEGFRQAVPAIPSLVKPNIDELQEFCGHKLTDQGQVISAAKGLLDLGIQTVIVSMGEQGALFLENDVVIQAIPPKVEVKSTVGAGDAMLSGMVAGKIEHKSLSDCARLATAFSVVAVSNIGAGIPSLIALRAIEGQVKITQIEG
jgi:1-phosphofructokinase